MGVPCGGVDWGWDFSIFADGVSGCLGWVIRQPETQSIQQKNRLAQQQAVLFSGCLCGLAECASGVRGKAAYPTAWAID